MLTTDIRSWRYWARSGLKSQSRSPDLNMMYHQIELNAEHYACLQQVVQKLGHSGLTLNTSKCQTGVSSISYMGHVLSDHGIRVSEDSQGYHHGTHPQEQPRSAEFPRFSTVL